MHFRPAGHFQGYCCANCRKSRCDRRSGARRRRSFARSARIHRPHFATGAAPQRYSARHTGTQPAEKWLFIGVSLGVNVFLFAAFGFLDWLYHICSLSIFLGKGGVTNLGQSLSEHPDGDAEDPTRSTYWWGNWILFNTGYHHEHHTFPNVACSRLPALRAGAPDVFNVTGDSSYFSLWWDHIRADFSPTRQNPYLARDNVERCGSPENR